MWVWVWGRVKGGGGRRDVIVWWWEWNRWRQTCSAVVNLLSRAMRCAGLVGLLELDDSYMHVYKYTMWVACVRVVP